MDNRVMRQFGIKMKLNGNADVRRIDKSPDPEKLRDPMTDKLHFIAPDGNNTASVPTAKAEGD